MDALTGIAFGYLRRASNRAASYANEVDRANGEIEKANQIIERKNQIIEGLEARIAELELSLAVKTAHAGGMKAYRDDLRAAHPNSPRLAPSGKRYKDGTPKPIAALAYDSAFDRILRDARISNPEQYRD